MPKNNFFDEQSKDTTEQKIILPKHHNWIWVVVILFIIALVGAAFIFTRKDKTPIQPAVTDFSSCKAAGGTIMASYPEQCSLSGKTFTNPDQKNPEEVKQEEPKPVQLKQLSYVDETNKFSIAYPENLTQTEADVTTPYTATPVDITSQIFSHSIPMQYCNPKGDCIPNTTDFSISFTVVNSGLSKITESPNMKGIADETFGTNKFKCLEQGVEGEGIVYCFISLPSGKTLMTARKFIDEKVLAGYKDAKDFITKTEQDKLAAQILTSLKFNETN